MLNAEAGKLISYDQLMELLIDREVHGGGGDREMTAAVAQLEKARDGDAAAQEKVIATKKRHLENQEHQVTDSLESVANDLKILVQLAEVVLGGLCDPECPNPNPNPNRRWCLGPL